MANEEHLAILKKGVAAWNEWREKNPYVMPDLIRADLDGAILQGADLGGVILIGASLRDASLGHANLSSADLIATNLCGARLIGTNLSGARLGGTNLREAVLFGANLSKAILGETAFTNARIGATLLAGVDLSEVIGLDTVVHAGPSTISIDTLYQSKGKIPEKFLRGCGVPEEIIALLPTIRGKPIEFYSCFISYSSKDEDFAKRLHADLQDQGVRVWFAPEDLKIGDKFRSQIDEAIRVYDKLLLVLSDNSINSEWVEKEVEAAFEKERQQKRTMLFPVRLDDAVMQTDQAWAADIRRTRHIGDMSRWKEHDRYQAAFDRLLRDLRAGEGKGAA